MEAEDIEDNSTTEIVESVEESDITSEDTDEDSVIIFFFFLFAPVV